MPLAFGGRPHPSAGGLPPDAWVGWQPTAAGGLLAPGSEPCMCMRCRRRQLMCETPSGRLPHVRSCPSCSTRPGTRLVILVHHASTVSPWVCVVLMLVWRAGACSHDGLTYQALCPAARVATAPQFWLPSNAQFIRVVRHCSAESGFLSWHPLRAHSVASLAL